ncbi:hypothetical protein QGM71_18805 [Virgibacillus sp. C22-A2]|uniref:Group-specific protein n=1 Tax=Virgibacillus tibetensis TaxID=3042313 RepID=A0ABU6KJN9_9BACI|nr:hypothetical protein [Virgibacillus sp. C22-A2]
MGACNIDHSYEDVMKKLKSQEAFLSVELSVKLHHFLERVHPQETMNELFHLLKKYDLSSKEEQEERNNKMISLIS